MKLRSTVALLDYKMLLGTRQNLSCPSSKPGKGFFQPYKFPSNFCFPSLSQTPIIPASVHTNSSKLSTAPLESTVIFIPYSFATTIASLIGILLVFPFFECLLSFSSLLLILASSIFLISPAFLIVFGICLCLAILRISGICL